MGAAKLIPRGGEILGTVELPAVDLTVRPEPGAGVSRSGATSGPFLS